MKHFIILIALGFFMMGCTDTSTTQTKPTTEPGYDENSAYGDRYFSVVWTWTTGNEKLVSESINKISNDLQNLWDEGVAENVYYNSDSKIDKFEDFPNIVFVIKAKGRANAERILDKLTIVKEDIATYTLFPIGQPYLDRKTEVINENGITKSFASIWANTEKLAQLTEQDPIVGEQDRQVKDLYEKGIIENAYFDAPGVDTTVEKTDFLFFVNAETEEDAKKICEDLPFFKEGYASYKVIPVGTFWMGRK